MCAERKKVRCTYRVNSNHLPELLSPSGLANLLLSAVIPHDPAMLKRMLYGQVGCVCAWSDMKKKRHRGGEKKKKTFIPARDGVVAAAGTGGSAWAPSAGFSDLGRVSTCMIIVSSVFLREADRGSQKVIPKSKGTTRERGTAQRAKRSKVEALRF